MLPSVRRRDLELSVLRRINDAADRVRKLERHVEPLYRDPVDRVLKEPLFDLTQRLVNLQRRRDPTLGLAEERLLPDEEETAERITTLLRNFVRTHYVPGKALRAGNTKTYGVVRAELHVLAEMPEHLKHGIFARPHAYRAWVRFGGPGPLAPADIDDNGVLSIGVKLLGVTGPKLIDDERFTQDFLALSCYTFQSPDVAANVHLHEHVTEGTSLFYFLDPRDPHLLDLAMQAITAKVFSSPIEIPYFSCVPFLLGEGQAVKFHFVPQSNDTTRVPLRPGPDYLREAMRRRLLHEDVVFDMLVQTQTDAFRMPIENASVRWPDELSPPVKVAELRIPSQVFDSAEQLAFAGNLSMNPWHSLAAHRPLGSLNRARKWMYEELSKDRQMYNGEARIEPTGDEEFPGSPPISLIASAMPAGGASGRRAGRSTPRRAPTRTRAGR